MALAWAVLLLALAQGGSAGDGSSLVPPVKLNPFNRHWVDSQVVDKMHGFADYSDAELDRFVSWGLNVVRLGFEWHLLETSPGVYNESYLDLMESTVRRLGDRGVYSILEMHQDVWSTRFCGGHGVPPFYAGAGNDSAFAPGGPKAYPEPWVTPEYGPSGKMTNCDAVGKGPLGWATGYATFAVGRASQRLYDNADGIASVLAFGLLNEPWLGEVPLDLNALSSPHWSLWLPGESDRRNLVPFYRRLHRHVRAVDDDRVIMFEPATGGNIADALPVGMSHGPGGPAYNDRQALSYHIYCPFAESDMPYDKQKLPPALKRLQMTGTVTLCRGVNDLQYTIRRQDAARLGVAGFLTEFGAVRNDTYGLEVMRIGLRNADASLHGWTFWYQTPTADAPANIARELQRPYARAVAGELLHMHFSHEDARFAASFRPSRDTRIAALGTELFVPAARFPRGVQWSVEPAGSARVRYDATTGLATVEHSLPPVDHVTVVAAQPRAVE